MYFDDFSMFLTKIIIFAILSIIAYNILKKLLPFIFSKYIFATLIPYDWLLSNSINIFRY